MDTSVIAFSQSEISAYYEERVPTLKRPQASSWRGPCPIHHGEDDNFAVNPETGQWFCHSACGRGGNIIALEMELTGDRDFAVVKAAVLHLVGRSIPNISSSSNGAPTNVPQFALTFLERRIKDHCDKHGLRHVFFGSVTSFWSARRAMAIAPPGGTASVTALVHAPGRCPASSSPLGLIALVLNALRGAMDRTAAPQDPRIKDPGRLAVTWLPV
jgi:CHC2-type zinc finger protein